MEPEIKLDPKINDKGKDIVLNKIKFTEFLWLLFWMVRIKKITKNKFDIIFKNNFLKSIDIKLYLS